MVATLNSLSILKLKLFTIQPANGGWRRLLSHISLKWQLNIKAGLQLNKHMSVATKHSLQVPQASIRLTMAYKIDTLKNVYHQKASKFSDRKRIKTIA